MHLLDIESAKVLPDGQFATHSEVESSAKGLAKGHAYARTHIFDVVSL